MKQHVLIVSLLGLCLATAGAWAGAADISGTWAGSLNMENGPQNVSQTFVFKQQGEKLTGTHVSGLGEHQLSGTVKAEKVVFVVQGSTKNGQQFKISYSGTIDCPAKIVGTVEHVKGPGNWTATKK